MNRIQEIQTGIVLGGIRSERRQQLKKWGVQNHDYPFWITILGEEFGEVAKEVYEYKSALMDSEQERTALRNLRAELIQVAAVAVAAVEQIDRQGNVAA